MKKNLLFLVVLFTTILACTKDQIFKDPEFRDISEVEILSANLDSVIVTANCTMYNPNIIPLDLSNMDFNVRVNEQESGTVQQTMTAQMPSKSEFTFPVRFAFSPKEVWGEDGSSLIGLGLQIFANKEFDLYMEGTVKAGAKGVFVKVPFEHEQKVDLRRK